MSDTIRAKFRVVKQDVIVDLTPDEFKRFEQDPTVDMNWRGKFWELTF